MIITSTNPKLEIGSLEGLPPVKKVATQVNPEQYSCTWSIPPNTTTKSIIYTFELIIDDIPSNMFAYVTVLSEDELVEAADVVDFWVTPDILNSEGGQVTFFINLRSAKEATIKTLSSIPSQLQGPYFSSIITDDDKVFMSAENAGIWSYDWTTNSFTQLPGFTTGTYYFPAHCIPGVTNTYITKAIVALLVTTAEPTAGTKFFVRNGSTFTEVLDGSNSISTLATSIFDNESTIFVLDGDAKKLYAIDGTTVTDSVEFPVAPISMQLYKSKSLDGLMFSFYRYVAPAGVIEGVIYDDNEFSSIISLAGAKGSTQMNWFESRGSVFLRTYGTIVKFNQDKTTTTIFDPPAGHFLGPPVITKRNQIFLSTQMTGIRNHYRFNALQEKFELWYTITGSPDQVPAGLVEFRNGEVYQYSYAGIGAGAEMKLTHITSNKELPDEFIMPGTGNVYFQSADGKMFLQCAGNIYLFDPSLSSGYCKTVYTETESTYDWFHIFDERGGKIRISSNKNRGCLVWDELQEKFVKDLDVDVDYSGHKMIMHVTAYNDESPDYTKIWNYKKLDTELDTCYYTSLVHRGKNMFVLTNAINDDPTTKILVCKMT